MTADAKAERERSAGQSWRESSARETVTLRIIMPDRWLEQVTELPLGTTVEEAKRMGLRDLLQRDIDHPGHFYVEYAERQVPDESITLAELGTQDGEILSIRAYDLGHYPRFRG
jgi:hypothetical protein